MEREFGGSSRLALLACLFGIGACSNANAPAASETGTNTVANGGASQTSTTSPTPTPTSSVSVVYDTSVGNGVDANGFADLPLRSGAHRYFVSSTMGADGNGCSAGQQAGTPLKSIGAAMACVQDGNGDQVLVAERTSYAAGLPGFVGKSGFDPVHPTVIESYDPTDALNEAKYGRASGSNRPVINTGGNPQTLGSGPGTSPQYLAIRGLDFNPGDLPGMSVDLVPNSTGANNYVLIENNIFRYTALNLDQLAFGGAAGAQHLVVRNNSFYGEWKTSGHTYGLYADNWINNSLTIEDNVFWHNGWKMSASRDDSIANGGLVGDEFFRHPIYQQTSASGVTRRNLIVDGAADGGQFRGNATITENVFVDNPTSIAAGGGSNYGTVNSSGVYLQVSYNAIFGDADITSAQPRGIAIGSSNGRQGSSASHNLIARSRNVNGVNNYAFATAADYDLPSYMAWDSNRVYQWTTNLQTFINGGNYPTQDFPTYTNNIWDAAASGSNVNNSSIAFPNPYTAAQLYAALGYADKTSFMNHAINYPEEHPARTVRTLLFTGYGMN